MFKKTADLVEGGTPNIGLILILKEIDTSWMETTLFKPFTSK